MPCDGSSYDKKQGNSVALQAEVQCQDIVPPSLFGAIEPY